jgi:hypothetical protein
VNIGGYCLDFSLRRRSFAIAPRNTIVCTYATAFDVVHYIPTEDGINATVITAINSGITIIAADISAPEFGISDMTKYMRTPTAIVTKISGLAILEIH